MSNNIELDGAELQALEIEENTDRPGQYLKIRPTHGDTIKIGIAQERANELKERLGVTDES